jgi:hypothetical protein
LTSVELRLVGRAAGSGASPGERSQPALLDMHVKETMRELNDRHCPQHAMFLESSLNEPFYSDFARS